MEKEKFIQQYVINYLACHAANLTVNRKMSVDSNRTIYNNQPIKDAHSLAESAWVDYCEYRKERDL